MEVARREILRAGVAVAFAGVPQRAMAGGEVRKVNDARRFADVWRAANPGRPVPKNMEAYEVSEYGRAPTQEDFDLLVG